jgi:pyroglutamyl-peptidase
LAVEPIVAALTKAGLPVAASDDAGGYVCNATFYRSLIAAPEGRMVGFVHVPPERVLTAPKLLAAAATALVAASSLWADRTRSYAAPIPAGRSKLPVS